MVLLIIFFFYMQVYAWVNWSSSGQVEVCQGNGLPAKQVLISLEKWASTDTSIYRVFHVEGLTGSQLASFPSPARLPRYVWQVTWYRKLFLLFWAPVHPRSTKSFLLPWHHTREKRFLVQPKTALAWPGLGMRLEASYIDPMSITCLQWCKYLGDGGILSCCTLETFGSSWSRLHTHQSASLWSAYTSPEHC